jgi:ADP-dependent NAD(P)H-hydrate dehydratase / NAD(P)H-hydrate epimerase
MKIVNVEEMRRIEQLTDASGHSYTAMMEMAGRAVADTALGMGLIEPEDSALVLVGPGNNGGDGLVAARFLRQAGHDVVIYIWKRDVKHDENFRLLKRRRRGIAILWAENDPDFAKLREEVSRTSVIVDALLGTGVDRPLDARLGELLSVVAQEITERRRIELEEQNLGYPDILTQLPLLEAMLTGTPRDEYGSSLSSLSSLRSPPLLPRIPPDAGEGLEDGAEDFDDSLEDFWLDGDEEASWPPAPVLAVDCPSGLNCDTGEIDPRALQAEVTVTFAYPKWGQLEFPGAEACGLLFVAEIGVPESAAQSILAELASPRFAQGLLPNRPPAAHKGTFGKALVVGGSLNYTGAVVLAGAAAARAGAGLVTAAIPRSIHSAVAGAWPELTWLPLPGSEEGTHAADSASRLVERANGYEALLLGPGLTTDPNAVEFVTRLVGTQGLDKNAWQGRTIFDADALNILAKLPDWWGLIPAESVLTPHPGEMGRLMGLTAQQVNSRRIENARRSSKDWGHVVLLKGPYTVVAHPDGRTQVIPFASATLATAGSGDVLAGLIAGMIAQGLPAYEAAILGAYLHGFAGLLIASSGGAYGATARDILNRIPEALQKLAANPVT